MIARIFRLQKKDIEKIFKKGQVVRFNDFLVRYAPNRTKHARFAIVIPKKTLAKAHDRNRARRLIYEFILNNQVLWNNKNLDLALFMRKVDIPAVKEGLAKFLTEHK